MKLIKNNRPIVPIATISFILFVAYFCTQVFLHEQYAVDGGLILSKKIIYPNNFSPLIDDYLGAWTSIYQISALLL